MKLSGKSSTKGLALLILIILASSWWILRLEESNSPTIIMPSPAMTNETQVHAPDGKKTLIMRTKQEGQIKTYSFFTADVGGSEEKLLLKQTLASGVMMISPNSWSPDDTYVFITDKSAGGVLRILVLKASGDVFVNSQMYLDVSALAAQSKQGLLLKNATGWASPTLLNLTTIDTTTAKSGPDLWFDVSSNSFLQHR